MSGSRQKGTVDDGLGFGRNGTVGEGTVSVSTICYAF
jgi:hypothetical protein